MSLLMDALRKAEQEKKEAAKKLEQTGGHARDADTTGAMEKTISEGTGDTSSEQPITRLDRTYNRSREEIFAATAQLSLEPIEQIRRQAEASKESANDQPGPEDVEPSVHSEDGDVTQQVQLPTADKQAAEPFNLELTSEHLAIDHDSDEGADSPMDESFEDDLKLTDQELPGLYDETIQGDAYIAPETGEHSYDETLPGVPAAELARDLGEEFQPTPVAAQTVFTASASRGRRKGMNWPLVTSLVVVVIIAFGIVAYQLVTPHVVDIPAQQLAGDLNLIQQSGQGLPAVAATTTGPSANEQPQGETAAETAASTGPVELIAPDAETTAGQDTAEPVDELAGAMVVEPLATAADMQAELERAEIEAESLAARAPAKPAETEVIEPGLLRISRSQAPDPRGQVLTDAYDAYKQGNFEKASTDYKEVLRLYPDNRDALLGLGAIAMKQGKMTEVYRVYSHLYRINPKDRVARAVLVNLDSQTDPVNRESTLKNMINDSPGEAFLHFSLGNIYASQDRWAEAQTAFFDAYRFDANNPDYALNLAVSLDHLGQSSAALDYYNTALKLADEYFSGFDSAIVLSRIQTLNGNKLN